MTLQGHVRKFLDSVIPADELKAMNTTYGLDLDVGSTFLDALAMRAAQLAENSERWAELAQQFEQISGGSGD